MFHKLKMKLVLINICSLSVILIIIFSGIYLIMKNFNEYQNQDIMNAIGKEEQNTAPNIGPNFKNNPAGIFYIKINHSASILKISSNITITKKYASSIVALASKNKATSGNINYNKIVLKYLKVQKQYGSIIVFSDKSQGNYILNHLLLTFLIIGTISLGFMFLISLFLANKALVPIKIAWDKQKNFIADASHELKTPLTVINTSLEIIMDNKEETVESQSKWVENAQGEINRMAKLLDDLLLIASSDFDKSSIFKAVFNISYALNQAILPFESVAYEKGITVKIEIQPEIEFCGDEGKIKQLIAILIDNAIKYTPQGGNVTLKLNSDDSTIEILVIDTGKGIAKEHLNKVFERFYRVEKSRSRSLGGSGLGLSIAECIVKDHNGNISASNSFGKGAMLKVTLPIEL